MTREEAIRLLDINKEYLKTNNIGLRDDIEALEMAIQALSQEPCRYWQNGKCNGNTEVCDDAISREAVINSLIENTDLEGWELSQAFEAIEKSPPVTQKSETVTEFADRCRECGAKYGKLLKQRSGKWIDDGFYAEGHSHKAFHCSMCGHNVLGFKEDLSKYCPNCGAEMFEPQESEEQVNE